MEPDIALLLADYKMDFTIPSCEHRSRKRIEERSTYCWAVDELEIYILSHVDVEPIDACIMFIRQMSYYRRRYPKWRAMCDTAMEVADDIVSILLAENSLVTP